MVDPKGRSEAAFSTPFVETVDRDQAAVFGKGCAKCGAFPYGLAACIEQRSC